MRVWAKHGTFAVVGVLERLLDRQDRAFGLAKRREDCVETFGAAAVRHRWIEVKGLRIHHLRAGNGGGGLMLLHGGSYDSASLSWGPTIAALSRRNRVWAPDLPGFGDSDKPDRRYDMAYYLDFLGDFMGAVGLKHVGLAGLSLGGMIATGFALERPSQVSSLILVDSAGLGRRIPWRISAGLVSRFPALHHLAGTIVGSRRQILRRVLRLMLQRREAITDALIEEVWAALHAERAGRAWASFIEAEIGWRGFRNSFRDRLGALKLPVLLIHGARDRLIPLRHSRHAHRLIPHSRLAIFGNCGHWVPRDDPQGFIRVVSEFLEELDDLK